MMIVPAGLAFLSLAQDGESIGSLCEPHGASAAFQRLQQLPRFTALVR